VVLSIVLVAVELAGLRPKPADLSWSASVPLWTSLSPNGKVVGAGPAATWASPAPAARLGPIIGSEPATGGALPPPRELPDVVTDSVETILPPGVPISQLITTTPSAAPVPPRPEFPGPPPLAVQATRRSPGRPSEAPAARISVPRT